MRQGCKIKDTYIKAISMFEENFKLKHSFVYHLLDKHYPSCSVFALAALLLKKKIHVCVVGINFPTCG